MDIQVYEEKILRTVSTELEMSEINEDLQKTFEEMTRTMRLANGIGIASNQVGIDRRYFVMEIDDIIRICINPEIIEFSEETDEMDEGCLSVPGIYKKVVRPTYIKVRYINEKGEKVEEELEGLWARCFQHETDHINGKLFIDRISPLSKSLIRKKLEIMKKNAKPRKFD